MWLCPFTPMWSMNLYDGHGREWVSRNPQFTSLLVGMLVAPVTWKRPLRVDFFLKPARWIQCGWLVATGPTHGHLRVRRWVSLMPPLRSSFINTCLCVFLRLGASRGFAFVEFTTVHDATRWMEAKQVSRWIPAGPARPPAVPSAESRDPLAKAKGSRASHLCQ